MVNATQAATSEFASATISTSFTVTAISPTITIGAINPRAYGQSVTMHAASASPAPITFSIVSGPATVSGAVVTTTGIGTVVVGASQPIAGQYTAASATTSFTVTPLPPVLSFPTIPAHIYGDSFTLNASSTSTAPITFSVTSGPARISGSTLTVAGVGEVWVMASQPASGGYSAASNTASFAVHAANPTLLFTPIPDQPSKQ